MKLAVCRKGEAIRSSRIHELRRSMDQVFSRYGTHENIETYHLAVMLTDEIDFDKIASILAGEVDE